MSVPRRGVAPIVTGSSPGGCSANALDVTTAERARAPPQPLLMVAKCSVIMGGQLVSRRRLFGCSGPKSGSAGSSWRPQLTQMSAAPQTMAPVLQDKPRHSTDLAELYSPILWSVSSSSLRKITDTGTIFAIWSWRGPPSLPPPTAAQDSLVYELVLSFKDVRPYFQCMVIWHWPMAVRSGHPHLPYSCTAVPAVRSSI